MKRNKEWVRYLELMQERPRLFVNEEELIILTDEDVVEQFEMQTGKTIGVVYESPFHLMVVDLVKNSQAKCFAYERLIPAVSTGAVVAIPVIENKFVLLYQYRHALRRKQYAFPRGFGEPGISSAQNVLKELKEELGAKVKSSQLIGSVVADSGIEGSEVSVYLCELENVELQYQYEGIENIELLTREELENWIAEGKIDDGFTLSAYCLLQYGVMAVC